ncbi:MAG: hypothetical protein ACLGXA_09140 [Acidobacteriota bacterium]
MKARLALLCLFLVAVCAQAQTAVYGAFSASSYNLSHNGWQYGSTFGLYSQPFGAPFVRAGFDLRVALSGSGNETVDSFLAGPRAQLHPHVFPVMPYAEALAGLAHVNVSDGVTNSNGNGFVYQFLGGLDITVLPRVDWRAIEYTWASVHSPHANFHPQTISMGIVLRMP